jgi:pentatricopeptide repeat protein
MDSDIIDLIENITNVNQLKQVYDKIVSMKDNESICNVVIINRLMTVAIKIEQIQFAIDIFESIFDFKIDTTSSGDVLKLLDKAEEIETGFSRGMATENKFDISKISSSTKGPLLEPNVFVCTTAVKAYGRKKDVQKALALLPFLERKGLSPDIYFFTSLLYILGKVGMVPEAEQLFWQEIPKRNLSYTVATTNSLMYMYAKLNRADDALKIYELTKRTGLACTVVTYGVLLKALIRSGKKQLQDTSFEILSSLQDIGIEPGIQVYNQFLEYFGRTMDFRQMKAVLSIMNNSKPRVKPDVISYGYLINGFADAKKPRIALTLFSDMCNRGIPPNVQTYMGVLKAFARLRDGVSSVQVLSEMREKGVEPDLRCYATAMFTCVVGNQCSLAEAIFANALKLRAKPDTVVYSLLLRALLQQGKWSEGEDLFRRMKNGQEFAKPNQYTFGWMLQFYILDNRFEDALQLIDTIVENYHVPNKRIPNSKQKQFQILSLSTTFDALSFALGSSSTKIERIRQEDKLSSQQKTVAALENAFREDNLIPKSEEGSALSKPTVHGLKFLTTCCEKICNADNGYIPCEFYAELLYALVTENMPDEIQRLLVLREAGQVKLKDIMKAKISSTESLALALLKSNKK